MEILGKFVDILLHLDKHLGSIIQQFGVWTYLILFVVVFLETGCVVTPFLPGDSLLFAAGAFDVKWLTLILIAASVLGDMANYWIGHYVGPKVFQKEKSRFFKKECLDRTHAFYEKHGGKAIILISVVPIGVEHVRHCRRSRMPAA